MKYLTATGKEISFEEFIELKDWNITVYGVAYLDRTEDEIVLLDPSRIIKVTK